MNTNRHTFVITLAASDSDLATSDHRQAKADEKDSQSVALGFIANATKTDTKKYPKNAEDRVWTNFALYQGKASDAWGGCPLSAGKQVAGNGWCSAWSKTRLMLAESATVPLTGEGRAQSVSASRVFLAPGDILPGWVLADLRTDHAGEVGAVCIYQGVLKFTRDPLLRAFAEHHLATEQKHLRLISAWLPADHHSRLLPLWRLAGFLTGALPALFGPKAVYATIEAVETFVNHHYEEQILAMASRIELSDLRQTLLNCQADEVAHRDEAAAARGLSNSGWVLRAWCVMVSTGSKAAVSLIRHI